MADRGRPGHAPLYGPTFSRFHAIFLEILAKSYDDPPEGWRPLLGEILDPLLYCECASVASGSSGLKAKGLNRSTQTDKFYLSAYANCTRQKRDVIWGKDEEVRKNLYCV